MSPAPVVDALAVLDRELVRRAEDRTSAAREHMPAIVPLCEETARQCREARAAVAELVASAQRMAKICGDGSFVPGGMLRKGAENLRAALARVGGAA